jgi:3-dehydroquinate synthase
MMYLYVHVDVHAYFFQDMYLDCSGEKSSLDKVDQTGSLMLPVHPLPLNVRFTTRLMSVVDAFASDVWQDVLAPGHGAKALVYIDDGVLRADATVSKRIVAWFDANRVATLAQPPCAVPGGEPCKEGWSVVERVAADCHRLGVDRHSYIMVIGGGAVLDAVGFAAGIIHRGIRLVRLPTTTLAQADAGLGVKNAINYFGAKNFLGTFQPPWAVVNDRRFLALQDDRTWRSGLSEAVKVALIKDADFFHHLVEMAPRIAGRDLTALGDMIDRCATIHLDHIRNSGDPFEQGSSRPLDFGHWSAHQLEAITAHRGEHRLTHGEAVAIGVALDVAYAVESNWLSQKDAELAWTALHLAGFSLDDDALDERDSEGSRLIFQGLEAFRVHLGGRLTLTMPLGLGGRQDIETFDLSCFERALVRLRQWSRCAVKGL